MSESPSGIVRCMHAPSAPARLLRRQRDLPLPRPRLRGAAVRARRRARRRLAADRLGRARVRALAPALARCGAPRRDGRRLLARVGRRPRRHELLLLPGHRPPAARHRRRDRVPARDRARRARRAHARATPPRSRSPSPASTCSPACASRASRWASRSRSPTPRCSRSTSCSPTASRGTRRSPGSTASAASMLIAAVAVTPLAGWAVVPALADPVALARRHRRRHLVVGDPLRRRPARDARAAARDLRADGQRCCRPPRRSSASSCSPSSRARRELAGVALVIAGVALHRDGEQLDAADAQRAERERVEAGGHA